MPAQEPCRSAAHAEGAEPGTAQAEPKSRRQRNAGILSFIHLYSNRDREGFPLLIWKGTCIIWKKQKLCEEGFFMGVLLKLMDERRISTANYITFVNPAPHPDRIMSEHDFLYMHPPVFFSLP